MICKYDENACAEKVKINYDQCRDPCEGLFVDYWKLDFNQNEDRMDT